MAPNDLTPCRMAFYFVSTFAIAQTPTKQPALRLSRTKNLHFAKAPFPGFSANAESIIAIRSGLAQVKIENIKAPVIDPDTVFSALEEDRHSGLLAETITTSPVRYQASLSYPGQLEKITTDGEVTIGQFSNGTFTACKDHMSYNQIWCLRLG